MNLNSNNIESAAIQAHLIADFLLESNSLRIMPREWLTKLGQAASKSDEVLIMELLQQIPDEHILLTQALQNKVDDFDFDDIVNLVQQASK